MVKALQEERYSALPAIGAVKATRFSIVEMSFLRQLPGFIQALACDCGLAKT